MNNKRAKLIAALLTLLLGIGFVAILVVTEVAPVNVRTPHADDAELFFADIDIEEPQPEPPQPMPEPVRDDIDAREAAAPEPAPAGGLDRDDSGSSPEPAEPKVVATKQPQPDNQKVKNPKEAKPAAPKAKPEDKPDPDAEKRSKINKRLGSAFGGNNNDAPTSATQGNSHTATGHTGAGTVSGDLGVSGRKLISRSKPRVQNVTGRVTVRITIDPAGHVTSARCTGNNLQGNATNQSAAIAACEAASMQLKYSPDPESTAQKATITWTIK